MFEAITSRVSALGWPGSSGMSATNAPIAVRRAVDAYGARKAFAVCLLILDPLKAVVPRKNAVVRTVLNSNNGPLRASRINVGALAPAGW